MSKPKDLISLREAQAATGRSMHTIRRWVYSGKLKGYKDGTHATAATLISAAELLTVCEAVPEPRTPLQALQQPPINEHTQTLIEALQAQVKDLQKRLDHAETQTDSYRLLLNDKEREIAKLRHKLETGVAGLIREGIRAFSIK